MKMELQSPALGLIHELGHGEQHVLQGVKAVNGKLPESPVIFGIEKTWADFYDEPIRDPQRAHAGRPQYEHGLFDHE